MANLLGKFPSSSSFLRDTSSLSLGWFRASAPKLFRILVALGVFKADGARVGSINVVGFYWLWLVFGVGRVAAGVRGRDLSDNPVRL